MTQTITTRESLAVQTARELGVSDARLQLVKDTYCKGATDDELSLFLLTAHRTGLDPAARQIFAVKRWDSYLKREAMSVQVSIDGLRLIADRTRKYVPGREPVLNFDAQGKIVSATAFVKKLVDGEWHEIPATAFYDEYVQTTKEGKPNRMWERMPRLMTMKCAESLALRKAFPAETSNLYTPEEMGTEPAEIITGAVPPSVKMQLAETVKTTADKAAEISKNLLDKQLAEICSTLKKSGDSISWSTGRLTEYANDLFDASESSYLNLDDEKKNILLGDLKGRLDEINERTAIEAEAGGDEAIDGEVVDAKTFAEEVF